MQGVPSTSQSSGIDEFASELMYRRMDEAGYLVKSHAWLGAVGDVYLKVVHLGAWNLRCEALMIFLFAALERNPSLQALFDL
jgi:hypothetical protein